MARHLPLTLEPHQTAFVRLAKTGDACTPK
jgi:hypothetical protein